MTDGKELLLKKVLKGQYVMLDMEGIENFLSYVKYSDLSMEEKYKFEDIICERDIQQSMGLGDIDIFKVYLKREEK